MKGGFHMVQLNKLPPPYLRMDSKQIDDRTKHEMLQSLNIYSMYLYQEMIMDGSSVRTLNILKVLQKN